MYHVRLHYDTPNWAYHRRCEALQKYAPDDFQVDIGAWHPCIPSGIDGWPAGAKYDLVLQLLPDHRNVRNRLDERGMVDAVLVAGLNVGYGHHEKRLRMCREATDHIVVNNRDCWERMGRPEDTTWISNGVDLETFRITNSIRRRGCRVLWTGGPFHCTQTNIKGWREVLLPLGERLKAAGIKYDFHRGASDRPEHRRTVAEMVQWYNTGTIYICTSSSEGTPNPALEAAACGCMVISTAVGNMPELIQQGINGMIVEQDVDAFFDTIIAYREEYPRMARAMREIIADWDWKYRAAQYYDLFRRLIRQGRNGEA